MRPIIVGILPLVFSLVFASALAAQTTQQLRIRWDAYAGGSPVIASELGTTPSNSLIIVERHTLSATLPRQRHPQLSSDQLLVQAIGAGGVLINTQLIPDPRVLRSEAEEPTGELRGELLYHPAPEFILTIPNDPAIVEIRIYHPRWVGSSFALDLIGKMSVAR